MKTFFKYVFLILAALTGIMSAVFTYQFFTVEKDPNVVINYMRTQCLADDQACKIKAANEFIESMLTFNLTVAIVLGLLSLFFIYLRSKFTDK